MKITILLLLFYTTCLIGMEDPKPMTSITKWQDVAQFAGKVIAYKILGGSGHEDKEYVLTEDAALKFGFIYWRAVEWGGFNYRGHGYGIRRLLKENVVHSAYDLTDYSINKLHPLSMRTATSHEIEMICKTIDSKKAEFQYASNEDFYSFLEKSKSQ